MPDSATGSTPGPASRSAWLFPGQGAQQVGMGRDLYERWPEAAAVFDEADAAIGRDLSRIIFEGPDDELRQTVNTQPAILVASLAAWRAAQAVGHPALAEPPLCMAGHSLGEYSALAAAGSLTVSEAVRLVQRRGELMQAAGEERPGTLAAVLGLDEDVVAELCAESGAELCNLNATGQIVVGGTPEAVDRAAATAEERGARRVIRLNVGGAFHTSLMQPAAEGMAPLLDEAAIADPQLLVIGNVAATPLRDAAGVRADLKAQIRNPVRWRDTVLAMRELGVGSFIEIGPGAVLTGLVRATLRPEKPTLINLNDAAAIAGESA